MGKDVIMPCASACSYSVYKDEGLSQDDEGLKRATWNDEIMEPGWRQQEHRAGNSPSSHNTTLFLSHIIRRFLVFGAIRARLRLRNPNSPVSLPVYLH